MARSNPASTAMPRPANTTSTLSQRRLRRLVVGAAVVIVICVVGDGILGMVCRAKIAAAVRTGMGADFSAGMAWYLPPRGVSLHHVRISKFQPDGDRTELFTASRVVIKLAEFHKKDRPLIISKLQIDSPSVTIISPSAPPAPSASEPAPAPAAQVTAVSPAAAQSTSSASQPAKRAAPETVVAAAAASPASTAASHLASANKLEIHNLQIVDGQLNFETPGEDTLSIDHINLAMNPAAGASNVYQFTGSSDENAPAAVKSAGSINVNDMTMRISDLAIQVKVGAALSQAHLSGRMKHRLEVAKVGGTLNVRASASVPLHDWWQSTFKADLRLADGKGALPNSALTIDSANGDFHIERDAATSAFLATVKNFTGQSGASKLIVDGGNFSTRKNGQAWQLAGLLGRLEIAGGVPALDKVRLKGRFMFTGNASGPIQLPKDATLLSVVHHEMVVFPRDASIQPSKYPIPVDHINGGPISFRAGVIRFENLNANYGGDQVLLDQAHITLDDPARKMELGDLRRQVRAEDISGNLVCHQPGPIYPAALGKVIEQLRPSGTFCIGGGSWYGINRKLPGDDTKLKPDYFFRVSTAGGAFALTDHKIPVTHVTGDANISAMLVDIQHLRGSTLGGTLIGSAKITPVRPVVYETTATLYNVNLQSITHDLALDMKKPLVGKMYLKTHVSGQGPGCGQPPLQTFTADGEFQIIDGNFGDIQTIRAAATNVTKPDQVLDGEAAGVFSVAKEVVTLENCAVGNPMFGLEGSGTIGFDKKLNLHAVAAPLGDWREGLKRSNVPVLEDVGSDIAGAIQQLFAGAQSTLLWDIHICGTTTAPEVQQTAAPAITQPVAKVFGQLIRGVKDDELIDQVREKK